MSFTQESAEVLALRVLGWLAANDDLMLVFQGASGVSQVDMKNGARDVVFLCSVLDFVLMDDAWVVQCCDALDVPYESLMQVRASMPGGEQIHWT